jgi:mono/diheme cytochrome c family protein
MLGADAGTTVAVDFGIKGDDKMGSGLSGRGRVRALLAAMLCAAACAAGGGCGGGETDGGAGATRAVAHGDGARTAPQPRRADPFARERATFRARCGGCHTLADAGTHGRRAGGEADLDAIRPNSSSVRQFVRDGYGAMPGFRGTLSVREIDALARYVAAVDGCGAASPTECTAE